MNDAKKTAGQKMLEFLRAKGRKSRKAGTATTEELAEAIGQSVKYTYDRLYWMEKKDGTLVRTGSGKNAVWRTTPRARKAEASPNPNIPADELETLPPPAPEEMAAAAE